MGGLAIDVANGLPAGV